MRNHPFVRALSVLVAMATGSIAESGCKGERQVEVSRIVEFRSYALKPGTRPAFHQRFVERSLPLLQRWNIDALAYGPSPHDEGAYFLVRAYPSLEDRQRSEDAFYGSDDWQKGPRDAVLADIESYTTFVLGLDGATVDGIRRAGQRQLIAAESTAQRVDATPSTAPTDRERLLVLNHEYVASYLSADTSWYNDHLADDFVCIESDGSVLDKSAFLAARAKGPDFDAYGTTETSLRVYGDTALVQDRDTATRHDGSKRTSRSTSVWMRRGGLWKAVSVQMTPCSQ